MNNYSSVLNLTFATTKADSECLNPFRCGNRFRQPLSHLTLSSFFFSDLGRAYEHFFAAGYPPPSPWISFFPGCSSFSFWALLAVALSGNEFPCGPYLFYTLRPQKSTCTKIHFIELKYDRALLQDSIWLQYSIRSTSELYNLFAHVGNQSLCLWQSGWQCKLHTETSLWKRSFLVSRVLQISTVKWSSDIYHPKDFL